MVSPVHPLWSWFISTHLYYYPIIPSYPFSSLLLILILPNSYLIHPITSSLFTPSLILILPIFSSLFSPFLILILLVFSSLSSPHLIIHPAVSSHPDSPHHPSLFTLSSHSHSPHALIIYPYLSVLLILICHIFPSSVFFHSSHPNLSHLLILICPFVSSTSHPFFTSSWPIRRLFMISLVMFCSFLLLSTVLLPLVHHPPLTPPLPQSSSSCGADDGDYWRGLSEMCWVGCRGL